LKVITGKTADKGRLLLINKIYELGFEVGYKNHSEIGWVLREYNALMKNALNMGIKSPESYYNEGKIKGRLSRDRGGIEEQESPEKQNMAVKNGNVPDAGNDFNLAEEIGDHIILKKSSLNKLPGLVKKIRATEIPKLLEGFKLSRRK
jgi:hypothetical protein